MQLLSKQTEKNRCHSARLLCEKYNWHLLKLFSQVRFSFKEIGESLLQFLSDHCKVMPRMPESTDCTLKSEILTEVVNRPFLRNLD